MVQNLKFEWDENKNEINQRKHGISFDEVTSVFRDVFAIVSGSFRKRNIYEEGI